MVPLSERMLHQPKGEAMLREYFEWLCQVNPHLADDYRRDRTFAPLFN